MSLIRQKYDSFATQLKQLHSEIAATQLDAPEIRQRVISLQNFFQQQIVPLVNEDTSSLNGRIQSYSTEMSKQLRLLEIDITFLQGARQTSTAKGRLDAIGNRLTTLIEYCNALLE
ncbi:MULTISPECIES: heterocyst frequency control protein PatD [Nostocales]|uniref:Heterocyst frequency control protein PatD n=3 Tax=Nostocales TaxID=1161 RepID=A0A0C1NJQ9_9CYAN|nr:heterocyst frequency control protein PatD [Tolypothrix bouteillei]KAF3888023.1 heterocyst frequency control protein PatD [Tolypothrix bouteillei VB521301]